MGVPPSFLLAFHWTDIEMEDIASTDTMVGADGANVCVMVGNSSKSNQKTKLGVVLVLDQDYASTKEHGLDNKMHPKLRHRVHLHSGKLIS